MSHTRPSSTSRDSDEDFFSDEEAAESSSELGSSDGEPDMQARVISTSRTSNYQTTHSRHAVTIATPTQSAHPPASAQPPASAHPPASARPTSARRAAASAPVQSGNRTQQEVCYSIALPQLNLTSAFSSALPRELPAYPWEAPPQLPALVLIACEQRRPVSLDMLCQTSPV